MDFEHDARTEELRQRLLAFMDEHVYPAEPVFAEQMTQREDPWAAPPVIEELKAAARAQGLWNLFAPAWMEQGEGLSNLQYAPLAEISGRSPFLAPEALNCSAPDTGNMELFARFGTDEQKERWLGPLLDGRIRSGFCMTEPDVASSDANNIQTSIRREGDEWVINGRKWWTTGAMSPDCAIFIVMGVTDPDAPAQNRQSMVLVPRGTPGMDIKRGLHVFGYDDSSHGGHAEVVFDDCRVPAANLVGEGGDGFYIAQARLGGGRIHHCMRLIGMAERAIDQMVDRVTTRSTFGRPLAEHGVIEGWIAQSRVRVEAARLMVLRAAWTMDAKGSKAAHRQIQQAKIFTPSAVEWVIDKAVQAHGAGGLSQDFMVAALWAQARTLRIIDGPDEVHSMSLAQKEIRRRTSERSS